MTMYLWLKLLAFGFAFLDTGVFVTGEDNTLSSPGLNSTEKPSVLAPSDPLPARTTAFSLTSISEREYNSSETTPTLSPDNPSTEDFLNSLDNANTLNVTGVTQPPTFPTHADSQAPSAGSDTQTPSSTATPPALTPAPGKNDTSDQSLTSTSPATSIMTASATVPTTPKQSCDEKYKVISVKYRYDYGNNSFIAKLNVSDDVKCENAICKMNEIRNLPACENKNVTISHTSCDPPNKIIELDVPPDPESFYLKTCTEPTKANISICLRLEKKENFTCDEKKITHVLNCANFSSSNKTETYLEPLSPKQNYSCNLKVLYGANEFLNKNETFETDVGSPKAPPNITCKPTSSTEGMITWESPEDYFDNYVFCLLHASEENCTGLGKEKTKPLQNLKPYTKYSVSLKASTMGKVRRDGPAVTCEFDTLPDKPTKVRNLLASRISDNSILVKCDPPSDFKGPSNGSYHLEIKIGDAFVKNESQIICHFSVLYLQYSTKYEFKVR
ncbi:receptor-type tyrosine-protein phosphatase C isoform X3 [Prionailurus bengalensis]|uniref:receptor-type tyrosine-protein phosphatase C isoform X3 n=1 Tax=Prionailurus bengalensis TaxID=37029 RepID=UPI001CAA0CF7|nr:receptor-type tyrosine-protein phosphatase C isoform X3 [Prionailurus bengalensis]